MLPAAARPDPAEPVPDSEPVDVEAIRQAVHSALAQGPMPRYEDLADLEQQLRAHIGLLLPIAEAAVDKLWRGGVEWYDKRCFLDLARDRMTHGLGTGIVSARMQVTHLAHDCRALLRYAQAGR
jgi:hypothetical protein